MHAAFVFALVLLLAVFLSRRAQRTVLSLAVIFLAAGVLVGQGVTGFARLSPADALVKASAEGTLLLILFSDGMAVSPGALLRSWSLPARALFVGFPLTVAGTALLAHLLAGLSWRGAFLLGATLAPTDPVFAAAIVNRERVSQRLRRLLNVESGLNDGLALPIVSGLLAGSGDSARLGSLAGVAIGPALGVGIPYAVARLARLPLFAIRRSYLPLAGIATGLLVYCAARLAGGNAFLALFAAGVVLGAVAPKQASSLHQGGETVATLAKFAAVFLFGALVTPATLARFDLGSWAFVVLALVLVRPLSILVAMAGAGLAWREWAAAGWFGPKGFASVVYAILILRAGMNESVVIFHLAAVVVAASMIAHSSTDVPLARWLTRHAQAGEQTGASTRRKGDGQDPATGGGPTG